MDLCFALHLLTENNPSGAHPDSSSCEGCHCHVVQLVPRHRDDYRARLGNFTHQVGSVGLGGVADHVGDIAPGKIGVSNGVKGHSQSFGHRFNSDISDSTTRHCKGGVVTVFFTHFKCEAMVTHCV